jgi:hypothetical protein
MARSTQKDPERQSAPEVQSTLHDSAEIVQPQDRPFGRSVPAQETLNIGHAGLRNECWAALRQAALRLQRPARKRTPLHCSRPSQVAEACFTSDGYEFTQ